MQPRLRLIALGGTISAIDQPNASGALPSLDAAGLIARVPRLADVAAIEGEDYGRVLGSAVTLEDMAAVAQRVRAAAADGIAGVIVTQGTDTLEETAYFLDLAAQVPIPVVVTGAMRHPSLPGSDGPANLLAAARVAALPEAVGLGALVVLNDRIHAAATVTKLHTQAVDTFVSLDGGPLGVVTDSGVHWHYRPWRRSPALVPPVSDAPLPEVALLTLAAGMDGRLLRSLPGLGFAGVVLAGLGGGHVPERMLPALEELVGQGFPVILTSRCPAGHLLRQTYASAGAEIHLGQMGVRFADGLTGPKARIALALALSHSDPAALLNALFSHA